jgi:hypothetical protein
MGGRGTPEEFEKTFTASLLKYLAEIINQL